MKRSPGFPDFYLRYAVECQRQGVTPTGPGAAAELKQILLITNGAVQREWARSMKPSPQAMLE